jgi:hypothetical protein
VKYYGISSNSLDGESTTDLLEVLEVSTCIFMCLSTKLASSHHVDESWLEFKTIVSDIGRRSSMDVGRSWSRELTEGHVSHGFKI